MRNFHWQHVSLIGLILPLLVVLSTGCGRYSHVNWRNPGRAEVQQNRAIAQHDPYPDPDAGPTVMGGRPREFDTPPPEPAWLQKRASPLFSPYGVQSAPANTAQPIYTTPAYPPNATAPPVVAPNYATPGAQPNYTPIQPTQPGYTGQ